MASFEKQKAEKLTIEDVASRKLDGVLAKQFDNFLEFLKKEKISTPWKSIDGFKMKYKSKNIGSITLGASGWLDNAIETKGHIHIGIETGERGDYDRYLYGQSDEIVKLFMEEQIINKCVHCRPTCGCSKFSGLNIKISGKLYENVCANATHYKFDSSDCDMSKMVMSSPCALYPPIPIRPVPIETLKQLILARKEYIEKMLLAKKETDF